MSVAMPQILEYWTSAMWRSCWQGGLVVGVVWLICSLGPRIRATHQSWLWRLAILKFVFVLLLPFAIRVPVLPAPESVPLAGYTFKPSVIAQEQTTVSGALAALPDPMSNDQTPNLPSVPLFLFCGWVIGIAWQLSRLQKEWREARRVWNQSCILDDREIRQILSDQGRLFGVKAKTDIRESLGAGSPMLVGIIRPTILVPADTLKKLNREELDLVVAHELAHVRRHDLIWTLVARVVRTVFFFHPLVWLCERRLLLSQEVATDELAVSRGDMEPVTYGSLLVSIMSKVGPGRTLLKPHLQASGPLDSLTKRLSSMIYFGQYSRRTTIASLFAVVTIALLGAPPWKIVAAQPEGNKQTAVIQISDIEAAFLMATVRQDQRHSVSSARVICQPGQSVGMMATDIPRAEAFSLKLRATSAPGEQLLELSIDARKDSLFFNHRKTISKVQSSNTILLVSSREGAKTGIALVTPELQVDGKGKQLVSLEVRFCDVDRSFFDKVGIDTSRRKSGGAISHLIPARSAQVAANAIYFDTLKYAVDEPFFYDGLKENPVPSFEQGQTMTPEIALRFSLNGFSDVPSLPFFAPADPPKSMPEKDDHSNHAR